MPVDLLMWVGYEHYPTIKSFVKEAQALGLSKRIGRLPLGVELGQSRLFFAHDEGFAPEYSVVFGYSTITHVEVMVTGADDAQAHVEAASVRLHLSPEAFSPRILSEEEESRRRTQPGATYLVSGARSRTTVWWNSGDALSYSQAVTLTEGRSRIRFRGAKKVDGDALLQMVRAARYPNEAAPIEFTLPALPPRTPWTTQEREVLSLLVKREGTYRGAKAFARSSPSRSLESAMYQVRQMMGDE